jgi:adenylate kinase family enzyme
MHVLFVIGPPGAGKSTIIDSTFPLRNDGIVNIDPDTLKRMPGDKDHEASIRRAEQDLSQALRHPNVWFVIYQGTGSWLPYMRSLFDRVSARQGDPARISLLFVTAPLPICLARTTARQVQTGQIIDPRVVVAKYEGVHTSFWDMVQYPCIGSFTIVDTTRNPVCVRHDRKHHSPTVLPNSKSQSTDRQSPQGQGQ